MRIHRTFVIVMMLVAAGLLVPRHGYAQQTDNQSSDSETEAAAAVTGRGDRRGRLEPERREEEQEGDSAQSGGSVNVQVIAVADERTNSVVVRGPAELLDLVAEVLASLDDTTVEIAGVKIFQLRYADAMNVADIINNLFGDEQSSQSDQRGAHAFC